MTTCLGRCWSTIKASANTQSYIHFSHLSILKDQVSLKLFIFLSFLL